MLDDYLKRQNQTGIVQSDGSFTLSAKASAKLGKFQLPLPGAWALKIVQAAVANECRRIEIVSTRWETQFRLLGGKAWSLDDLERAFHQPQEKQGKSLRHLLTGLRAVAFGETRGFMVTVGEQSFLWSGNFHREPSTKTIDGLYLTVSHSQSEKSHRLLNLLRKSRSNAEVLRALARYAYTCPIPLTLDSRRLDVLQYCPDHGWGKNSFPIAIGYSTCELPALCLPSGGLSVQTAGKKFLQIENPGKVPLFWMLTAHLKYKLRNPEDEMQGVSTCYFVGDGVEVGREPLLDERHQGISLNAFISAEGLGTDASNFYALRREEYQRRVELAGRSLIEVLRKHRPDLDEFAKKSQHQQLKKGALLSTLFFVVPGLNLMAVIYFFAAGYSELALAKNIQESWLDLGKRWKKRYKWSLNLSKSRVLGKSPLARVTGYE